ncbi:DUF3575 domain-containing protein [Flavobacterium humi]|uniref:DUF3575 domain-containing protein n=1 Tax=Flavobacterium humi TaxID=2562683 RepID=A0A4Z0LC66_9FLAO|nr:DUF3575 domain-containing protein [Flavobacterium humi]TGD59482.1 DUF3575 domain-containing protein [Flavobacterium humi]
MRKFFFILLYTPFLFSQSNEGIDNDFCIKTNPLSLIDVYGSYSYRIGLETKIYKNFAFSAEVGNYFNYGKNDGIRKNSKGYIIKPEVKWYLNKNGKTNGDFVSLEYTYKDILFDWKDSIPAINNPNRVMDYRIQKKINCLTVKIGNLKAYSNNLIFEWFVGIGLRISKGKDSLTDEERNSIKAFDESEIANAQKNVNYILPNLSLGIKIGYRLF